ncbi:MAG: molecular chaperone DnaJ [Sodaliphilus pleomorphus]|jgi:DnaJ-class molecular chaperone|uniref:molecular chaperone DnaJ n=1 Tax=Sodaliphilus pleomorphus TaxID=2606626 RepID=UPI002A75CA5F|nr:molecular chaperone DnaJ [Sodaliphilus pleomorphus]MDY2833455.1 molecular chaperone DnaJ [Sodaliphilus pleomorphus]MDY5321892.1 molecular chaperone DnaJ [Prevotella sp.]
MKMTVNKSPKIALCRKCRGTGLWRHESEDGVIIEESCPQCEGTGRVTVSAVMEFDIRPYRHKERQ